MSASYRVGPVAFGALSFADTLDLLARAPRTEQPLTVQFCAAHAVVEAARDPVLARALNGSTIVAPDGMPLVWIGRRRGFVVERVCGPDLMLALLDHARTRRHFFYGGVPGVVERLAEAMSSRFPGLQVGGLETPPFRALTPAEDEALIARINATEPDYVWVGLGTPKQYLWAFEHRERLRAAAILSVGAAFDFHAGVRRRAPRWMQRSGTEWLFRLASDPRRLWRRYTITNVRFAEIAARAFLGLGEERPRRP